LLSAICSRAPAYIRHRRGGRWKVFKGQNDGWLEEYRLYFRKDGLLIKENDDAINDRIIYPKDFY